jgi:hypothetical protein
VTPFSSSYLSPCQKLMQPHPLAIVGVEKDGKSFRHQLRAQLGHAGDVNVIVRLDIELEDETQSRATVSSPQHLFCSFDGTSFRTRAATRPV